MRNTLGIIIIIPVSKMFRMGFKSGFTKIVSENCLHFNFSNQDLERGILTTTLFVTVFSCQNHTTVTIVTQIAIYVLLNTESTFYKFHKPHVLPRIKNDRSTITFEISNQVY